MSDTAPEPAALHAVTPTDTTSPPKRATRRSGTTKRTPTKGRRVRNWKPAFLTALTACPDVSKACAAAGITRSRAYAERQADEAFAIQWHDAINVSLDALEAALIERGMEKDTTAAIFLLKSHRRDVYGDNLKLEHSGRVAHDLETLDDEQLDKVIAGLEDVA